MRHLIPCVLALALLLSACTPEPAAPASVAFAPEWDASAAGSADEPTPDILLFQDLTQSMLGFSGSADSPIARTVLSLTNRARFSSNWHTYLLEPDEGRDLQWQECNPLLLAAAVVNDHDKSSYTTSGDFDQGGPLSSVFCTEADPGQVSVLVTDLLEQEGQLSSLYAYAADLFAAESHQQLYIAIADSPFCGRVSYPAIEGEALVVRGTHYEGQRPFAVIAAGPAEGVSQVRSLLHETDVAFEEFLVENMRPPAKAITLKPAPVLAHNILVGDMALARCTLDLAPLDTLDGCNAFFYSKVSADHTRTARLSLQGLTSAGVELKLVRPRWMQWLPVETVPQTSATEDAAGETEPTVTWAWTPCEPPEGITLELRAIDGGSAVPGHTPEQSGLEDLTIPDGMAMQELSLILGEETAGSAYSLQADLITDAEPSTLASSVPFQRWSISFSLYGQAAHDPSILTRIPDLCLLLDALAGLDDSSTHALVGEVRIVIQNYEPSH